MAASKKEKPIIEVKHLSKQYSIGIDTTYKTLCESVTSAVRHPIKTLKNSRRPNNTFWALKNVNFEVDKGEVLGIIGRNGAGKSTLLKILSRITYPTEGEVRMRGRVGSLLEVGTGFHPELSGRENIYFNGSILGMKKREIDEKFDEIVKFSGVEKFLDTPVKRYSSGMQVRLAFSVAANLDPEILVVDEVLAVGDAEFQKKCLGKMKEVAEGGRTVLFVSHNMNAIEQMCKSCILLEKGNIKQEGSNVSQIVKDYLSPYREGVPLSEWINDGNEFENPWFKPYKFIITDSFGNTLINPISNNQDIWIQIEGNIDRLNPALEIGYSIYNEDGITVYTSYFNDQEESKWPRFSQGNIILRTKIPKRFLNEGIYTIELRASLRYQTWITEPGKKAPTLSLHIQGGLSDSPYWTSKRQGVIAPLLEWKGMMSDQKLNNEL
jgi:lipopolysaccharide transport system ATP-binding protein